MDPNHPSNASFVPGHVTPPNQPVHHVRPINLSNNVYSHPEFQPQPQFQPMPQFQPHPQFMPQPQQQTPPSRLALVPTQAQPSINYPPYDDMIFDAIRDLNEPDGSSKTRISRRIKRSNAVLPPSHAVLMTYHLKTLRKNGVLTMVNNLYKISAAAPPPPRQGVAVAADLVAPRYEVPPMNSSPLDMLGQSSRELPELPVTGPNQVVTESANRRPDRPRRDGSVPISPTAGAILGFPYPSTYASMQQRGRPPSPRAAVSERKRLCIGESSGGVVIAASAGGETVAVASRMWRGPGCTPNIVWNRPRESATPMSIRAATGTSESAYGELKRKLDFACEKAKKILDVLNAGIENYDFIEMLQARQEVEGLIPMLTVEPHAMRQVQPQAMEEVEALPVEQPQAVEEGPSEEAAASGGARKFLYWAAQTEAETQGEEHGQEVVEGEQAQPQP
uniref:H15 domain-containing protein n=1 Tax=Brassica campestris TaxID=3711 RepID=M4E0H7_BRACM|nr:unnamed protein product [Brassica rapa]